MGTEDARFIVNKIDIRARLVNPADEEIAFETFFRIIPLNIGFGIQIGGKGTDYPGAGDIGREMSALNGKAELVSAIAEFQVEVLVEFESA